MDGAEKTINYIDKLYKQAGMNDERRSGDR